MVAWTRMGMEVIDLRNSQHYRQQDLIAYLLLEITIADFKDVA